MKQIIRKRRIAWIVAAAAVLTGGVVIARFSHKVGDTISCSVRLRSFGNAVKLADLDWSQYANSEQAVSEMIQRGFVTEQDTICPFCKTQFVLNMDLLRDESRRFDTSAVLAYDASPEAHDGVQCIMYLDGHVDCQLADGDPLRK